MNRADGAEVGLTATGGGHGVHLEPFVLEFLGLPGAGKTAVAAKLVADLRARGVPCAERRAPRNPSEQMWQGRARRVAALVRDHELIAASLRFAASVRPRSLDRLARALRLSGWARQYRSYATSGVELIVLDQGPLQDVWSLTVPGRRWDEPAMREVVRRILHTPGMGRAFVYVDVDVQTAAERLRLRRGSSSRFDRLSPAQMRTWLETYEKSLTSLLAYAAHVTHAPCWRLDGTLPVDEGARTVARFLHDVRAPAAQGIPPMVGASGDRS